MRQKHSDQKFVCFHCQAIFTTTNGFYKHKRSHFNLPYACSHCTKRFQFPKQLTNHMVTPTRRRDQLYKCLHCDRIFIQNKTMLVHAKTHNDQFKCQKPYCSTPEKIYNSKGNLAQHERGEHGPGWLAECAQHFKWKSLYYRHIRKCKDCKAIRKQKKDRYHFL